MKKKRIIKSNISVIKIVFIIIISNTLTFLLCSPPHQEIDVTLTPVPIGFSRVKIKAINMLPTNNFKNKKINICNQKGIVIITPSWLRNIIKNNEGDDSYMLVDVPDKEIKKIITSNEKLIITPYIKTYNRKKTIYEITI